MDIIKTNFGDKFDFLKVLEIVYNTSENTCTISFLYPQNAQISKSDKQLLADFLTEKLSLSARLVVKFQKSFLDSNLIQERTFLFFKTNRASLKSVLRLECINVHVDTFGVEVCIVLPDEILATLDKEKLAYDLSGFLKIFFIAEFEIKFSPGQNIDHAQIEASIQKALADSAKKVRPVARYKVFDVFKLIGKDITPEPEFLSNIRTSKQSVILAGLVKNFEKRTYKRMRNEKEIEKTYYKFSLYEENRFIPMVYFCPKQNITKMDKLVDGTEVLLIADIKKEHGNLNGYVRDLSLCQINQVVRKHSKEKITKYSTVFPQKYEVLSQANIFDVESKFDDNITNNTFVVFDVETTGIDAENCEITEIGAVKVSGGKIIEKFQSLVKPQNPIPDFITELTGITNEMVQDAPKIENVIRDFYLFTKNTILAGYNVGFDVKFIQNAARQHNIKFENDVQDVLTLARQKVSSSNYKLSTIVKTLNLTLDNAHRAFYDALATAEVLLALSKVE